MWVLIFVFIGCLIKVHFTVDTEVSHGKYETEELAVGFEYDDMISRYIARS